MLASTLITKFRHCKTQVAANMSWISKVRRRKHVVNVKDDVSVLLLFYCALCFV